MIIRQGTSGIKTYKPPVVDMAMKKNHVIHNSSCTSYRNIQVLSKLMSIKHIALSNFRNGNNFEDGGITLLKTQRPTIENR